MIIGLTGNIGSGKSLAAAHLRRLGAFVIDADEVSHLLTQPQSPLCEAICREFGAAYFDENGVLLRKKLGELVFADKDALRRLEALTQPAINEYVTSQLAANDRYDVQVVEATLIIEANWFDMIDELWLVEADDELRVQRVVQRNGLTPQQVRQRMANQMPQQQKRAYAQRIFTNNDTPERFLAEIEQAYAQIRGAMP